MNYLEVKDRILTNLGIEKETTNTIKIIQDDIVDTIRDIYAKTEYPRKFSFHELSTDIQETIEEDFEDTNYNLSLILVQNLSFIPDYLITSDSLVAPDYATFIINELNKVNKIIFYVKSTDKLFDLQLIIEKDGNILFSESKSLITSSLIQEIEFSPALSESSLVAYVYFIPKGEEQQPPPPPPPSQQGLGLNTGLNVGVQL